MYVQLNVKIYILKNVRFEMLENKNVL